MFIQQSLNNSSNDLLFFLVQKTKTIDDGSVVRVQNHNEMNQYISQKKKDAVQRREEKKKQQHTIHILEGGVDAIGSTSSSSIGNEL